MTKDLYDKLMVFGSDQEPFLTHNFMRTTDLDDGTATVTLPMHRKSEPLGRRPRRHPVLAVRCGHGHGHYDAAAGDGSHRERHHRLSVRRCRRQHP